MRSVSLLAFLLFASLAFSATCSDTDGGINVQSVGTVTYSPGLGGSSSTYTDGCETPGSLVEYYCTGGNQVASIHATCADLGASYVCQGGACVDTSSGGGGGGGGGPRSCTDTDGGPDPDVQGTTTVTQGGSVTAQGTDSCSTSTGVLEYSCTGQNQLTSQIIACESGMTCSSGACVTSAPTISCTDTDDGVNPGLQGTATVTQDGTVTQQATDTCSSSNTLVEYSCSGDAIDSSQIGCGAENVCQSGACIPEGVTVVSCTDSDGGIVRNIQGTTTLGYSDGSKSTQTDGCMDSSTLREYSCSGTVRIISSLTCGSGEVCTAGACVASAAPVVVSCSDSDGGIVTSTRGTATLQYNDGSESVQTDTCASSSVLNEYYCTGATRATISVSCGSGMQCSGGSCVSISGGGTELFCTDSDGGDVRTIRGTVRSGTRDSSTLEVVDADEETDWCVDSGAVREYLCDGVIRIARERSCPLDYVCQAGRCLSAEDAAAENTTSFCTDSDGWNLTQTGTIQWGTRDSEGSITDTTVRNDFCLGDTSVLEYHCEAGEANSVASDCDAGYLCENGRCFLPSTPSNTTNPNASRPSDTSFADAQDALSDAEHAIAIAREANKNVSAAVVALGQAENMFRLANFTETIRFAQQAERLAIQAPSFPEALPPPPEEGFDPLVVAGIVVVLLGIGLWHFLSRKPEVPPAEPSS